MKSDVILSLEDVSFRYDTEDRMGDSVAIDRVSLNVERGSFVAVLGRNGSGKSTLAKLMNGVLLPTEGRVLACGMDTSAEENLLPIRRKVGMVFQNPDNQLVSNLVEEDVAFGPENLGVEPAEIRRRVDEALKIVGMSEFFRHSPHKLSGGQKQRVAIAGILAMNPECLLLDESTAMLDPVGRREIMDTVLRLNREQGLTVVLITHHMDEAVLADRVIVMDDGRVVMDDVPQNVFSDVPFLHTLGLDAPQVTELVHLLFEEMSPSQITEVPLGILNVEQAAEYILKLFGKE